MEEELLKHVLGESTKFMNARGIKSVEQVRYLSEMSKKLYAQQVAFILCSAPIDLRGKYLHYSAASLEELILDYEQAIREETKKETQSV